MAFSERCSSVLLGGRAQKLKALSQSRVMVPPQNPWGPPDCRTHDWPRQLPPSGSRCPASRRSGNPNPHGSTVRWCSPFGTPHSEPDGKAPPTPTPDRSRSRAHPQLSPSRRCDHSQLILVRRTMPTQPPPRPRTPSATIGRGSRTIAQPVWRMAGSRNTRRAAEHRTETSAASSPGSSSTGQQARRV